MRKSPIAALLALILVSSGCGSEPVTAREGYVDAEGGRVWYRVLGARGGAPLILLHGGPGATSHYLEPLARLAEERPVVFYDQLGSGRSDRPDDPTLWRIERFVDELSRVRAALGIDEFHLFGHSWGALLAVEYMATEPRGVLSLILASPALDIPRWSRDAARLRAALPIETQETLSRHERAGTVQSPEYREATNLFYGRHVCRLDPWPVELQDTFSSFGDEVYNSMWGPTEFHLTGSLKDYARPERLKALAVPVLFTTGRHDLATPEAVASFQALVPGSRQVIFENSGHMTMLDERDAYVAKVREFLNDVER
jgi:proline-specific peptidase